MADINEAMRIFHVQVFNRWIFYAPFFIFRDYARLQTSEANVRCILDNDKRQLDEQRAELVRERDEWQNQIRMLNTQVADLQATIAHRDKKIDDQNVENEQLKEVCRCCFCWCITFSARSLLLDDRSRQIWA